MRLKDDARPIAMILLVVGIVVLAVMEAEGYTAVSWFRVFAMSIVGEWFVERGIRKGKHE